MSDLRGEDMPAKMYVAIVDHSLEWDEDDAIGAIRAEGCCISPLTDVECSGADEKVL